MTDRTARTRLRALLTPHSVVIAGIIAVMAVTFAVLIASLDRGFDWSDEGFVYVMVASNRVSTSEYWGFQYLLNPVYELLGGSVLAFRVLRLLGYVVLGIILTLMARALLRSMGVNLRRASWVLVGLVAQIGTFAAFSYPPRYLGYNELSSWFTQLGAALVIFLLLEGRGAITTRPMRRWPAWLALGVVVAALILVKVTSGILLLVVAVAAAALAVGGARWRRAAALVGGIAVGFVLMLVTGVPLLSFLRTTFELGADPSAQADSGYSVVGLLRTYVGSMFVTVGALALPIVLTAAIVLVVRGFRTDPAVPGTPVPRVVASAENVAVILAVVLALLLISASVLPGQLDSWATLGVSNAFLLVLAILVFAVLVIPAPGDGLRPAGPSRARSIAILAFAVGVFTLAPLISAAGTNNRIFGHTVFSATIWAVGAAVALVVLWERSTAVLAAVRMLPVLFLGVIVVTSGLAVAGDVFIHPYGTVAYFTQKATIDAGDLRGIRVTENEADLYEWLHDEGESLHAQDVPAVSLARPASLLAFNASGWTAVWPGRTWAASIARSCEPSAPDDLFVLQSEAEQPGEVAYDRLAAGLNACGIDFPDDFEEVDRHPSDDPLYDVTIWRLT